MLTKLYSEVKKGKKKIHEQLGVDTDEAVVELVNKLKGYDELLNSVETLKTENNALKEKCYSLIIISLKKIR